MASYYKVAVSEDSLPLYKGFHLQKVKKFKGSLPRIKYDFSKHVLIELLDNSTPESRLWAELGVSHSKSVVHKRMMVDSHRIQCRRALVVCVSSNEAKKLAERISQTKIMNRSVCAVVVEDLLSDLCLFEKQIMQFGDSRPQHQFVYVTDLNRCREPSSLVKFLKETFSPFGTILSVLVCSGGSDGYAHPEGVIRFAYLSEAFAAELALDQFVVGRERLSVTSHHNILLSQCDLRVRLREAQWKNGAEPEPRFDSYKLNDLSHFDENSVVNSINSLCITSKNVCVADNEIIVLNNLSGSYPREDKNLSDDECNKDKADNVVCGPHFNSRNIVGSNRDGMDTCKKNSLNGPNKHSTGTKLTNCHNMAEQITSESYLNSGTRQECSTRRVLRDTSDCESFVSCIPDPKFLTSEEMSITSVHSDGRNAKSEYYSISSDHKQFHHDSKLKKRPWERRSKKRKYFTPSQKLCLKSQRVGFCQHTVQNVAKETVASQSCSSQSEKSMNGTDLKLAPEEKKNSTSKNLSLLPEEPGQSKVTSWLSSQPTTLNDFQSVDENLVSNMNVHKNRISVHSTPSLNHKNVWKHCQSWNSDNSSVENDDPNENVVSYENSIVLCAMDKFHSPLQAWLKQELVSSIHNNVTQSQETSKSVIVCAARTKDFIISVGCSHMTCNFCYPDSTDLLLGFS